MSTTRDDVPGDQVREFDHYKDLGSDRDPYERFEELRGHDLVWSPEHGGFWITTSAEAYRRVLHQPASFSNFVSMIPAGDETMRAMIPMNTDPPDHTKYRQVLAPMFSPTSVGQWESETRQMCNDLIDQFIDDGRTELVWQFARIVPLRIFLLFMGLESANGEQWTEYHAQRVGHSPAERAQGVSQKVWTMLHQIVDERAESPDDGDDYPRLLLRASFGDRPLTRDEVFGMCWNLFIASLDTTANAITQFLHYLALHPDVRQPLAEDIGRVPVALEELLRTHSFVNGNRTAIVDADVLGVHIKSGDQLLLSSTLACADPAEFECPTEFRLDRFPNHHLAFGAGPHRCLGSHLARMELRVELEEWHRRIPEYRLPENAEVARHGGHLFGIERLELEWDLASTRPRNV